MSHLNSRLINNNHRMIRLIEIKPRIYLFTAIGLIPFLFLAIWLLAKITGPETATFNAFLVFGSIIGHYLFWIYTISYSLDLLNIKNGLSSGNKKYKILLIILASIYVVRMFISLPYFDSVETAVSLPLNIILGIVGILVVIALFYNISDNYIFQTKNRIANFIDYFFMTFYFALFIVGLMILHSEVRTLLIKNNIIEK